MKLHSVTIAVIWGLIGPMICK